MLRELRKKAGLTQQELAEAVGISRPTITCYETGRLSLDVKIAKKIAKVLKCKWWELYENDEDEERLKAVAMGKSEQKVYIVELESQIGSYYLASLSGTYSKIVCDAVIFMDELEALKYATVSEMQINDCISQDSELFVGKIAEMNLSNVNV